MAVSRLNMKKPHNVSHMLRDELPVVAQSPEENSVADIEVRPLVKNSHPQSLKCHLVLIESGGKI